MSTDLNRSAWIADLLARWLRWKYPASDEGRRILRLVCAPPGLKVQLSAALAAEKDGVNWVVRDTADEDAVRMRHGRPSDLPEGPIRYVVLWSEGAGNADRNAQSLRDLTAYDVADVLGNLDFEVPLETEIRGRCVEAAQAWEPAHRNRAAEHLAALWDGLRRALRLAPTKRQVGALRLVDSLERWSAFLHLCWVDDGEWNSWPSAERAERLMARLGSSLPALGWFRLPALASVLGAVTNPKEKPPSAKQTREAGWATVIEELLAENAHWVTDPGALSDALAGNKTLREQLDRLVRQGSVLLVHTGGPDAQDAAASALEDFCRANDAGALEKVDWIFYEPPGNRRGKSMGLKGLLIARGRRESRSSPVEALLADTLEAFKSIPQVPEGAAAVLQESAATSSGRKTIAVALSEVGGEGRRELPQSWREVVEKLTTIVPAERTQPFRELARRWRSVDAKKRPDFEVAPTLLLALTRLCRSRVGAEDQSVSGGALQLRLSTDKTVNLTLPVDEALPEKLQQWLAKTVIPSRDEIEVPEEDGIAEVEQELTFEVARVNKEAVELGQIALRWRSGERDVRKPTMSTTPRHRECSLSPGERPPTGLGLVRTAAAGETRPGPGSNALGEAWRAHVRALGYDEKAVSRSWEIVDLVAPVSPAARKLVDTWQQELEVAGSDAAEERVRRQGAITTELQRHIGDPVKMTELLSELTKLQAQSVSGATPSATLDEVRKLISFETYQVLREGQVEKLVLSPHHPLVLRLRVLADTLLFEIFKTLWSGAWPADGMDDLDSALEGWALPEPQHLYGPGPKEPLVFDGWVSGHAVYSRLGTGRDADVSSVGIKSTRHVLTRFRDLFPAAADRLALRIHGDEDCRWAWNLIGDADQSGVTAADIDLVTALPIRTASAFESRALGSGDDLWRYEPGADGGLPGRRFRRVRSDVDVATEAHLSLLLADRLTEFKPSWTDALAIPPTGSTWDLSNFFHEVRPQTVDYRLVVHERSDPLSCAVDRVVARACGRSAPIRECFDFDPASLGHILQKEQRKGRWLVLVSRQPAYRAIQASQRVAALLDFSSRLEGGRPVNIAVSVGAEKEQECSAALSRACMALLGAVPGAPERLLHHARSVAPLLALQAMGSEDIALSGLVGLLLTANAIAADGQLVLSLDQHQRLLGGTGILADLITVSAVGSKVVVRVAESKFTTNIATMESEQVSKALKQVEATTQRLRRFVVPHPLAPQTRNELVRATIQQIHMLDGQVDRDERQRLSKVVDMLASASTPLEIAPLDQCAVHVWSWESGCRSSHQVLNGIPVAIHGREDTEAALKILMRVPSAA